MLAQRPCAFITLFVDPLAEFAHQSFCGDARPVQLQAARQFLGTRLHLGLQSFAQRLDQGVYGEVITRQPGGSYPQLLHALRPVELVVVAAGFVICLPLRLEQTLPVWHPGKIPLRSSRY
jgi:hypothetical protein